MLKTIELFAGIGSQSKALKRQGIPHEVVAICEWDKYAYKSYEAVHGPTLNYGDITKVESLPQCDLLTYSFPCQDLSVAGKGAGIKKGTRSGLLYEVERLLFDYYKRNELPRYLLLENVKNLVGKQHKPDFDAWLEVLSNLGYNNYWQVLNAKNYGVPQNRERVFVVSILKEHDKNVFEWPEPFDNGLRLKDFLEIEVDEKYYVSDEKCAKLIASTFNQERARVQTLTTSPQQAVVETNECRFLGNINNENFGTGFAGGVWDKDAISPTLTTMQGGGRQPHIVNEYRIRKLTPRESFRLMGFDDEDFDKAEQVNSNSQLYKQAGNSIVVDVLEYIFHAMYQNELTTTKIHRIVNAADQLNGQINIFEYF